MSTFLAILIIAGAIYIIGCMICVIGWVIDAVLAALKWFFHSPVAMLAALLLTAYTLYLSGELEGNSYKARVFNEYAYTANGYEFKDNWPRDLQYLPGVIIDHWRRDYWRVLSNLSPATESAETWYYWKPYRDYAPNPWERWRYEGYEPYRDFTKSPTGEWRWRLTETK